MAIYRKWKILTLALIILINTQMVTKTRALVPDFLIYEGRLIVKNNSAQNNQYVFRFSFWSDDDFSAGDLNAGAINTNEPSYAGWQEIQQISLNQSGFFSAKLGSVSPLPEINASRHRYLQVEIKRPGESDSSFQLMDPTGDNGADNDDRKDIGSLPYALTSKTAERAQYSLGNAFVIDPDNAVETAQAGAINLQFGNSLGKILSYNFDQKYFNFNDNVNIEGDLTVAGTINGVDVTNLAGSHAQNTDSGTTADSFTINSDGSALVFDTSNLSATHNVTFPDADTTLVGEDTAQELTNKTIDGEQNNIINLDKSAFKDRAKTISLAPAYPQLSFYEDGSDNLVTLNLGYSEPEGLHYYALSSKEATLQDLNLKLQIPLPDDFNGWQAEPIVVNYKTANLDLNANQLNIQLFDSAKNNVSLNNNTQLVSQTWKRQVITLASSGVFDPSSVINLDLQIASNQNGKVNLGVIELNYYGK